MQVVFKVVVDNPVAAGIGSIDNTATVASLEQSTPQYSSTTDDLPPANLGNLVWHDDDNDGVQDAGELGLSGVTVYLYLDLDRDGLAEPGGDDGAAVAAMLTDANGNYQFTNILANSYFLVFEQPSGYTFSPPDNAGDDALDSDAGVGGVTAVITLSNGQTNLDVDAGLLSHLDYGDLPGAYDNTLRGDDGARHQIDGLYLGGGVTTDRDGNESPLADGDTQEDGVVRTTGVNWSTISGGSVDVTVNGGGYLSAWIDWNGDNDFADAGENILLDHSVGAGTQTVTFSIPTGTAFNRSFNARFRLYPASTGGAALPTGYASGGEVEDYQWTFGPTAVTLTNLQARTASHLLGLLLCAAVLLCGLAFLVLVRREPARDILSHSD
jgi:hypothetical protein